MMNLPTRGMGNHNCFCTFIISLPVHLHVALLTAVIPLLARQHVGAVRGFGGPLFPPVLLSLTLGIGPDGLLIRD